MFCGFGEQMYYCGKEWIHPSISPSVYCTQYNYETWLKILEDKGIIPSTIIIDDGWQLYYGEQVVDKGKWPDMRGFIDKCHAKGQKVILWPSVWSIGGIPNKECINRGKKPMTVDTSNPAYLKRLKRLVHYMLSNEKNCLNADGLKVGTAVGFPSEKKVYDLYGFGMRYPEYNYGFISGEVLRTDERLKTYGEIWGAELLKNSLRIYYEEAKKAKKDALIITVIANPYFSHFADMVTCLVTPRIDKLNIVDVLKELIGISRITLPHCLLNTEVNNEGNKSEAEWLSQLEMDISLGCVPHIFYATHLIDGSSISDKAYKKIKDMWGKYKI